MTDSRTTSNNLHTALLSSLAVAFIPILLRVGSTWTEPSNAWAFALPGYLPLGFAFVVLLAPIVAVGLILQRGARHAQLPAVAASGQVQRGLWLLLVIPAAVLALPDSAGFMGDYLIRQGAVLAGNYAGTFPQSLPLDRFVQGTLVPALGVRPDIEALPGARWMGFVSCLATTWLAHRAMHLKDPSDSWSWLGVVVLAGGGYLCLLTGYARDAVELLPLTLLVLVTLHERTTGTGRLSPAPELALGAMLLLHRSSLCLLPAYLIATSTRLRTGARDALHTPTWAVGALVLGIVVLSMAPRYAEVLWKYDLPRHAPWLTSGAASGPPITDAKAMWDALNAVLMLAPSAIFAWLGVVVARSASERWFLLASMLGWLVLALFVRPQQGAFRDYDTYACLALTLSYAAAVGLRRLSGGGVVLARVLMIVVTCSTLQATLALLLVSNRIEATEARVRHGLTLAVPAQAAERAGMFDYLGLNAERRQDWSAARNSFRASAEAVPSQARLVRAGRAAALAGDWEDARTRFSEILGRDSSSTIGWCGYAATTAALTDSLEAARAEQRLLELCRTSSRRKIALGLLDYAPELDPSGKLRQRLLEEM